MTLNAHNDTIESRVKGHRSKKTAINLLKLIGIALFVLIVFRIDKTELAGRLAHADPILLSASFGVLLMMVLIKTIRWHFLMQYAGSKPSLYESWRLYNIGIFLGTVTPAKVGEFGKAAYMQKQGMKLSTALAVSVIDRVADLVAIIVFGIAGAGILFGQQAFVICLTGVVIGAFVGWMIFRSIKKPMWLNDLEQLMKPKSIAAILCLTLIGWFLYFTWAIFIAYSIEIHVDPMILTATFTLTGLISMMPIAPSGLGTRDAALLTLLAPYGITGSHAVALAMLMLVSIIVNSGIGGVYFLTPSSRSQPD